MVISLWSHMHRRVFQSIIAQHCSNNFRSSTIHNGLASSLRKKKSEKQSTLLTKRDDENVGSAHKQAEPTKQEPQNTKHKAEATKLNQQKAWQISRTILPLK